MKRAMREADHSLPSSAEVNEGMYTPSPDICVNSVYEDSFTFFTFISSEKASIDARR